MIVDTKTSFEDDLEKIPAEDASKILKVLKDLKDLKSLSESTHLLKMRGKKNTFRYRVGDYRIVMCWNKHTQILNIETVEHRKNVYKKK
jgi:mRNA-degrading endonuclease RelE of RelBE toxin-antitoxin system